MPQQIIGAPNWASNELLQFLVLPMFHAAGLPSIIQMINVAVDTPQSPISAYQLEFHPENILSPQQIVQDLQLDSEQILQGVNDPNIFTLFHGHLDPALAVQGGQYYQMGTHWQPVIPQELTHITSTQSPHPDRKRKKGLAFSPRIADKAAKVLQKDHPSQIH